MHSNIYHHRLQASFRFNDRHARRSIPPQSSCLKMTGVFPRKQLSEKLPHRRRRLCFCLLISCPCLVLLSHMGARNSSPPPRQQQMGKKQGQPATARRSKQAPPTRRSAEVLFLERKVEHLSSVSTNTRIGFCGQGDLICFLRLSQKSKVRFSPQLYFCCALDHIIRRPRSGAFPPR